MNDPKPLEQHLAEARVKAIEDYRKQAIENLPIEVQLERMQAIAQDALLNLNTPAE